jgi:hypothetical protein
LLSFALRSVDQGFGPRRSSLNELSSADWSLLRPSALRIPRSSARRGPDNAHLAGHREGRRELLDLRTVRGLEDQVERVRAVDDALAVDREPYFLLFSDERCVKSIGAICGSAAGQRAPVGRRIYAFRAEFTWMWNPDESDPREGRASSASQ